MRRFRKTTGSLLIVAVCLLLMSRCEKDPTAIRTGGDYMSLQVGDIRQFIVTADSSTILFTVVGTTYRSDGTPVFAITWQYGTREPDTSYYLIKNGYFMATELDTTGADSLLREQNPFREQRLARIHPQPGDSWKVFPGSPDSPTFTAHRFDQLTVLCGTFHNVFGFTLREKSDPILTTFYAPGIGWIGTADSASTQLIASASYLKVGRREIGRLLPPKNPVSIRFVPGGNQQKAAGGFRLTGEIINNR